MRKSLFETILSFLLGISWAFFFLGALLTFDTFIDFGFFAALFGTIVFAFVTLLFILLLETMNLYRESHEEKKKQTQLLSEIKALLLQQKSSTTLSEAVSGDD